MTKEQLYRQLQAKVYEIIYPQGIPPEEGVQFTYEDYERSPFGKKELYTITYIPENSLDSEFLAERASGGCNHFTIRAFVTSDNFKKFGKPLSLQDIIKAALDQTEVEIFDGKFYIYPNGFCDSFFIDLEESLQEQNKKTLQSLIDLLT